MAEAMTPETQEPQTQEESASRHETLPVILRVLPVLLALVAIIAAIKILQGDPATAANFSLAGASSNPYPLTAGTPAPDFSLKTLDGQTVSLHDYQGKAVMVNFWATWCPPCRSEMPDMQNLYSELKGKGVEILAVNVQEARPPIEKFVTQFGLTFPILLDVSGDVVQQYGVQALPTSYFIDREGRISAFNFGALNGSAIRKKLEAVLE